MGDRAEHERRAPSHHGVTRPGASLEVTSQIRVVEISGETAEPFVFSPFPEGQLALLEGSELRTHLGCEVLAERSHTPSSLDGVVGRGTPGIIDCGEGYPAEPVHLLCTQAVDHPGEITQDPFAEVSGTETPRIGFEKEQRPLHLICFAFSQCAHPVFRLGRVHGRESFPECTGGTLPLHPAAELRIGWSSGGSSSTFFRVKILARLGDTERTVVQHHARVGSSTVPNTGLFKAIRALKECLVFLGPVRRLRFGSGHQMVGSRVVTTARPA
jgi:hypothetical protein